MSTNLFLTKGASIEAMNSALPKQTTTTGFFINETTKTIEYNGNPKALKFVIPTMVSVVESLDKKAGFSVVRTPKSYVDKSGNIKTTNVTTFTYTNLEVARILVDNVNNLVKANYESYKNSKGTSKK